MWTLWIATALAGSPTAWIGDNGVVSGTVSLPAPPAAVVALVSDAVAVNRLDGGSTRVSVVRADGSCSILDYTSPSMLGEIKYRVRTCPTATGSQSSLVQSDSFSKYHTLWSVTPEGAGSLVRYDLEMVVSIMVPSSLVESTSKRAVRRMLTSLLAKFTPAAE